jgi:colanic acid/amylovoran biosynthesis protein
MTFLLAGHAGCHNRGCEAILRSTLSLLRERFGSARFFVSSFRPGEDRKLGLGRGVSVIPACTPMRRGSRAWARRQWARLSGEGEDLDCHSAPLWRPLRRAEAVLSIGGDNYTVDYGYPFYYLKLNRLVREAGRRLIIWGASIGPFPPGRAGEAILEELRGAALITARESLTVDYLAENGLSENVRLVADPAFLLRPEPLEAGAFWPRGEGVLGLNLSPLLGSRRSDGSQAALIESAARLVRHCVKELGLGVLLVPHVAGEAGNDDHAFMRPLLGAVEGEERVRLMPPWYGAAETKQVISRCRYLVAGRTHAAIAGFGSGVPTLLLSYSRKGNGISKDVFGHCRHLLAVDEISGASLISAVERLREEEQEIRAHLEAVRPRLTAQARAGAQCLAEVLGGEGADG